MRKFRFLRSVIYKLKRRFGTSVTFVRIEETGATDFATGAVADNYLEKKDVRNAIFLPYALTRNFSYDLSYIAANKNFTYGGMYDTTASTIICDKRDLKGFELDLNAYVLVDCRRHEVKKIQEAYQDNTILIIQIVETKGER
ncbi:MAG: hypothetical protein DRH97_01705 [Chloroflexi bacterium]|nr:MAG: hypothetical protein DRH97_01705 [Chloroflexota bacterium]